MTVLVMRFNTVLVASISCLLCTVSCSSSDGATVDAESTSSDATEIESLESVRGLRYCEVLLLDLDEKGLRADVYNTYPLNDCPDNVWSSLDGGAIAAAESKPFAILNGPRFWLMDTLGRANDGSVITKTFRGTAGDMDMNRYAEVVVGTPDTVGKAYVPQSVDRRARLTFRSGSTIFVLTDDTGRRFVMQSWSQQRDPSLTFDVLASLADRLDLPDGWTFTTETLTEDLVLDSTMGPAQVFQDELMNTYSLMPD